VDIRRGAVERTVVICDGIELAAARVDNIDAGRRYRLQVLVP